MMKNLSPNIFTTICFKTIRIPVRELLKLCYCSEQSHLVRLFESKFHSKNKSQRKNVNLQILLQLNTNTVQFLTKPHSIKLLN